MFDKIFDLITKLSKLDLIYDVKFKIRNGNWIIILYFNDYVIKNYYQDLTDNKDLNILINNILQDMSEHAMTYVEDEHKTISDRLVNTRKEVHDLEGTIFDLNDLLKKIKNTI